MSRRYVCVIGIAFAFAATADARQVVPMSAASHEARSGEVAAGAHLVVGDNAAPPNNASIGATGLNRADATSTTSIVYSDLYLKLTQAFPSGWVWDSCSAVLQVTGRTGVCSDAMNFAYFYPDGTFGKMPWNVDAGSPTGWSVEPDPCNGLSDDESAVWAAYVDWLAGYVAAGPDLTNDQIERYAACWGYWF